MSLSSWSSPTEGSPALFLLTAAAVVALLLLNLLLRRARRGYGRLPYFSRRFLLSKGGLTFYDALRRALPAGLIVAPKVRLLDVINCAAGAWRAGYGGRISQKHLDFVLAVELDDRTLCRPDRSGRSPI